MGGQFRLGKEKRSRVVFEPKMFGFHAHATRETGVWIQTLTWTLERSTGLSAADKRAIRRFLADYQRSADTSVIIMIRKPLQLAILGPSWAPGQSPRLRLPTSLGAVCKALETLAERDRHAGKPTSDEDKPMPMAPARDMGKAKQPQDRITYTKGKRK